MSNLEMYKKFPRRPKAGKGKASKGKSKPADRPFIRRKKHKAI